nr:reverse transcriptase domain-containing protein [Tanacetum cinerariifolium]
MSSPNYPTSDIEDAFSSTYSTDYTPASPGYFLASPGNTSPDPSNDLSKYLLALLGISPFPNDPYMKVMHAYDAIIPPQVPILSPIIMPPSPMLSPIFNPQEFFVLEELLPPKEQISYLTSSSTDLSNPSLKQAYTLVPPSFLVYTPTPPQIFEIGKCSIKMHLKHHEKQIEDILNYLKELSFHRIEKIEERLILILCCLVNVDRMAPKRTSTAVVPAMNQAAIRQLTDDRVAVALKAQAAYMANTNNTNRNPKPRETYAARKCTYKEFMSCQPIYFNGTEGAVGLIRWFERTE